MKNIKLIGLLLIIILLSIGIKFVESPQSADPSENFVVKVINNQDILLIEEVCSVKASPTSILSTYQLNQITNQQYQCLLTHETIEWLEKTNLTFAAGIPNDPDWLAQHALEQIEAPTAWDVTTGDSNIIVAVIDSGVDYNHPDLSVILLPGFDFVNGDANPQDDNGHGTHIAGIIAAQHNNQGVAGISPQVKILPIKVLDANGIGSILNSAMGIRYAVDQGADIINTSYSSQFESEIEQEAIQYALDNGVIVVAASGDDGLNSLGYPAGFPGVISVGAVDVDYQHSSYSNASNQLDLSAPGSGIYSTCLAQTQSNAYCVWSGTSMSAAHVTGMMVLLKTTFPNSSPIELLDQIKFLSTDIGVDGYDAYFGAGLINLSRTLQNSVSLPVYNILDSIQGETTAAWIELNQPTELDFSETSEVEISLSFGFSFGRNEADYSSLFVHQDGFISLTSLVLIDEGKNLPVEKTGFVSITPFWDNLEFNQNSSIRYQQITHNEQTILVIEWTNLTIVDNTGETSGTISFQAQITDQHTNPAAPNNDIIFSYTNPAGTSGNGQSATIGLAFGESDGTQYCVNAPQGCVVDGQSIHFYHLAPPGQSQLVSIGEIINNPQPAFTWDAVPFADHYRLYISNSNGTFWNHWYAANEVCVEDQCAITLDVSLPDSNYHWWIQTSNQYGGGPWSEADSFTLMTPPEAPILLAPLDESITNPPEFSWAVVENAIEYRLEIQDQSGELLNQWFSAVELCSETTCAHTPSFEFAHGAHSWQVQGRNLAGEGAISNVGNFDQINPPAAPVLISPSGIIVIVQPTFTWVHLDTASAYAFELVFEDQIYLTKTLDANTVCNQTSCSYSPENPLFHGDFSWRVAGSNPAGQGPWSSSLSFSIDALPAQPILIEPSGTVLTPRPELKWELVDKATEYRVYISNYAGMVLNTWQNASILCDSVCSYTLGFDLEPGNYHWFIQPRNAYGSGPWSNPMTFTVDLSPQTAILIAPESIVDHTNPTFSWNKAANADQYRFFLLDGSGTIENTWLPAESICDQVICQYQMSSDLHNGHYTWYVQTRKDDQPGSWNQSMRFTILALPETPTLISPVDSIEGGNVTLQWTDEFNTIGYHIFLSGPAGIIINQWVNQADYCSSGICSYSIEPDLYYGPHFWFIRGSNWAGNSAWTEAGSFEVINVPGAAILISPEGTETSLPVKLIWTPVSGSTLYRIYVTSNSGALINAWYTAAELCDAVTCEFELDTLIPDAYTWFVQTKNDLGSGPWSESLKFTFDPGS